MVVRRCFAAFALIMVSTQTAVPCRAQTEVNAPTERYPGSLQNVVGEIAWKSEQQGVLLIVAPEMIRPQTRRATKPGDHFVSTVPATSLPTKSPQGLPLFALERYFSCVPVPCGGVTVLAPTRMTMLNFEKLPQPSLYADLKPTDAFQLLQGTLTKAQWQRAASPEGLGMGDLTAEQGELFLAAFPVGTRIQRLQRGDASSTLLQENQQRGIRVRFVREMSWLLKGSNGGGISFGERRESRTSLVPEGGFLTAPANGRIFGADTKQEVPAHFKTGQLPFDWDALDAQVDLSDLETVDELVARARKATRVELYCDPHYAFRSVYLRGGQACAGDVLKALARGVNGTWRRVGNTYVLTDDVVGLATRQMYIYNWLNRNAALGADVDRKILAAIRAADPAPLIQFPDDGFKPSDSLWAEYREYEKSLYAPREKGDPPLDLNKLWPVKRLPEAVQSNIQKQLEKFAESSMVQNGQEVTVNTEAVQLSFDLRTMANVPGVGWAETFYRLGLPPKENAQTAERTAPTLEARALPAHCRVRACIIRLSNAQDLKNICQAATRAGFTEIWADVEGIAPDKLKASVQTVQKAKLKFRALVSAFRQKSDIDKSEGVDWNVLGETYTQYLSRTLQNNPAPPEEYAVREHATVVYRDVLRAQQERGDWSDPGALDIAMPVSRTVEALLQNIRVDGIVVRDADPPGYELQNRNHPGLVNEGGYTVARRVAFIRRFGTDPVDISTSRVGSVSTRLHYRRESVPDLQIPEFSDNGRRAGRQDSNSSATAWNQFRQKDLQEALRKVQARLQTIAGETPVWFYRMPSDWKQTTSYPTYVESRDKRTETTREESGQPVAWPDVNVDTPTAQARSGSSVLLYNFDITQEGLSPVLTSAKDYFQSWTRYYFDPQPKRLASWDGIVFDLSSKTTQDLVALLELLPAAEPPRQASDAKPAKQPVAKPRPKRP